MRKIFYVMGFLGLAVTYSCKKDQSAVDYSNVNKIAPNGFDYKTTRDVSLNLKLLTNADVPIAGAVVNVYATADATPGTAVFTGVTDATGTLKAKINVASAIATLVIDPSYIGLMHNATAAINDNAVTATIGGKAGYSGDIVADAINNDPTANAGSSGGVMTLGVNSTDYAYPLPYTNTASAVINNSTYPLSLGRPNYLESTPDVIDASMLSYVNASLPENQSVATKHPEYLTSSVESNINVTANSDVYVTYVSEGASYESTLAYYTYNTNNPPSQATGGTGANGIDKVTIVFPNESGLGSGGGLRSGDKVKLGTFNAGTTIAFVLLQNAWTGSGISLNTQKFYGDSRFNPESTAALRKHSVMLYDNVHKVFICGFEDLNRDPNGTNPGGYTSDNDFNDIVFYTSATPNNAISTANVATVDKNGDTDGDGVLDVYDAYPTDATRAYNYYYPSATTYAQLAFEDNWPAKGDYDMNDLVVNYRYKLVLNAAAQLVTFEGDYVIAAAGASFKNGFGLQLPFAASSVQSVTGQQTISNYIQFASNGVEAGQSKAVIIPFDNHEALIKNPDNSYFINTLTAKDKVQSSTASVLVTFVTPQSLSGLSVTSFNPFLISNLRRGYEVHLPGFLPTDKANLALFGTSSDASLVAGRAYYTSQENYPWAISFANTAFAYPLETISVITAYPHFTDWASSSGNNFADWYSNLTSGYRNNSSIYSK